MYSIATVADAGASAVAKRVAHHAVGAAIHDVGDAPGFAGDAQPGAAQEGLYVIQAGHARRVLRAISEMTLMDPEM